MRKQFAFTMEQMMAIDDKIVILLGDIGVHSFKNCFEKFPNRTYNIGILEQSMVGMASGLASEGFIPIIHTIAPFLVERAYEQIKLDFAYQKLNGNFVSVGNSYDYSALGITHQCPNDVSILKQIPNFEIVCPGNSKEFDMLFKQSYYSGNPTYFRLSEYENSIEIDDIEFGKASIIKRAEESKATVIAVGNLLDKVVETCKDLDVTILYYHTVKPFDYETLFYNCNSNKILLCEPYTKGGLSFEIMEAMRSKGGCIIDYIGVENTFTTHYGDKESHDLIHGIRENKIREKVLNLIYV